MAAPSGNKNARKDAVDRDAQLLIRLSSADKEMWAEATALYNEDKEPEFRKSRNDFILEAANRTFKRIMANEGKK